MRLIKTNKRLIKNNVTFNNRYRLRNFVYICIKRTVTYLNVSKYMTHKIKTGRITKVFPFTHYKSLNDVDKFKKSLDHFEFLIFQLLYVTILNPTYICVNKPNDTDVIALKHDFFFNQSYEAKIKIINFISVRAR